MWIVDGGVCLNGSSSMLCASWPMATVAFLAPACLLLGVTLGLLVLDSRRTATPSRVAARANRHATLASLTGVAALLVVVLASALAGLVGPLVGDGRTLALMPAFAGTGLLIAEAVGQVTWPRPTGAIREAVLQRRRVLDVVPPFYRRLIRSWAAFHLLSLAAFAVLADGPRTLDSPLFGSLGGYPGIYYGVPMAVGTLALVGSCELVLRLITWRPAVVGVNPEWDHHLRQRSARHVLRGVQFVLAMSVAGTLGAAGAVYLRAASQVAGVGLLVASVAALVVGAALTFLPARRRAPAVSAAAPIESLAAS